MICPRCEMFSRFLAWLVCPVVTIIVYKVQGTRYSIFLYDMPYATHLTFHIMPHVLYVFPDEPHLASRKPQPQLSFVSPLHPPTPPPRAITNACLAGSAAQTYRTLYVSACAAAFVNAMTFSVLGPFFPAYIAGRFGSTSTQVSRSAVYNCHFQCATSLFQHQTIVPVR